jgi:4-amino-4-deoxy-L-arabinose transferase-like glycosyltransferase
MNTRATISLSALCLLPCAFLYLHALDRSPVYLGLDEAHFAVHARSLADTGRDLNGDPFPLFINLADPLGDQPTLAWGASWYHPFLFYVIALSLKVLPFTEAGVRAPTAIIAGIVNVGLMYVVAMRLFERRWLALTAALMLALTPAHLVLGRQALDYVCPLPFQLAWLWCLLLFRDTERRRFALAGGLILGVGCYSYVSSWAMMPAYLALSWFVYRHSRHGALRPLIWAAAGFALPVFLLIPWWWRHPQMFQNLLEAQSMSAIDAYGRGRGLAAVVARNVSTYWSYFNPAFLFLTGGPSLNAATGQAGVFLLPLAVLLPVGIATLLMRADLGAMKWILLIGFFLAPLPPTLKGESHVIQRTLGMLPFAIAISTIGVWALWRVRSIVTRVMVVFLLIAMPVQFAFFYDDYLTDYRLRSASAYDRTAFVETANVLLNADSQSAVPGIYLTAPLYDVSAKWRFYATKANRTDLLTRTRYFDGDISAIGQAPPGSLAVVEAENPRTDAAVAAGVWSVAWRVADITQRPTLTVLRKIR